MQPIRTVLVADDDSDVRSNMKDILDDLGYRVDTAHDGGSALHLARENSYDVALLDFRMPGIDGVRLFQEIRRIRPGFLAIMVTAFAGAEGIQAATDAGIWKVLRKPVDIAVLLSLLQAAESR